MGPITLASTGLDSLDNIINNLQLGDNVVWQVDTIEDYKKFVIPYTQKALKDNRKVVYIRFACHEPLIEEDERINVYELNAYSGFESFSKKIYTIISEMGEEAFYIFDCLSDLLSAWATDLMIGNFFVVTCPYLYELNTVAYFSILRNCHNYKTIARIRGTTQLLIDIYKFDNNYYVHPLKVLNRYSPTMFLPHHLKDSEFSPIINSAEAVGFVKNIQNISTSTTIRNLDFWDRLFMKVEELIKEPSDEQEKNIIIDQLCKIIIGYDERILSLAKSNLLIEDFVHINDRLIGTGFIGGKAVGMLLARKILENDPDFKWNDILEPHDSFYIGTDVFHTFIVQNGLWKLFMEHKTEGGYFEAAIELKEKMLEGTFPDEINEKFQLIVEYFGQSPFIVRSSSLLEDAYGNAFAGKYESYFCVNQGSPRKRYEEFLNAVRQVYASTMDENALNYRLQRKLHQRDEQMALLIQRVSGTHHKHYFFPDIGGVGLSYNIYVWNNNMNPDAGMLRLVSGLGTRAVDRVAGDYPRIVALDSPLSKPHAGSDDIGKFSQHYIDVLNTEKNILETIPIEQLTSEKLDVNFEKIAVKDKEIARRMKEMKIDGQVPWLITFDPLLSETQFPSIMKNMMKKIESVYDYPVDVEYTINFTSDQNYRINLLQCRPLQTKGIDTQIKIPENIPVDKTFFKFEGNFLGGSIAQPVKRIIYVDPRKYGELSLSEKYDVARLIGSLNKMIEDKNTLPTMLMGPGRWGSTMPSLGVPVRFAEIYNISILIEIAEMRDNIMPELSYGTHFFLDLVEANIFYIAIFPEKKDVYFDRTFLNPLPNILPHLVPDSIKYNDVVQVFDIEEKMEINADIITQKIVCYK